MTTHRQGMEQEVAVSTVIQSKAQSNDERTPRWSRTQRAALFDQYLDLQAQGLSLRQAAKALEVPRSTLQSWRAYQESLDEHPTVVVFFKVLQGWPSCIVSCSGYIWCARKWVPVVVAWCVCYSNSQAAIALLLPPMASSNRSTARWRQRL